jgi:hypothetical protein
VIKATLYEMLEILEVAPECFGVMAVIFALTIIRYFCR